MPRCVSCFRAHGDLEGIALYGVGWLCKDCFCRLWKIISYNRDYLEARYCEYIEKEKG